MVGGVGDDGGVAKPGMKRNLSIRTNIMTPVKPMLVRRREEAEKETQSM